MGLGGFATPQATREYAERFELGPDHFRLVMGLSVSSLGVGTYLGDYNEAADRAYAEAIREALKNGINLIDTAVNYRLQRSERVIGKVLAELAAEGVLRRSEIVICTKGGYITFDSEIPANPADYFETHFIRNGLIPPDELVDNSHCISARYIEAMVEQSRQNLGLDTIDVYYLHNPETQLSAVSREEFLRRLTRAFEILERKVAEGRIGVYGVATWQGFRVAPDSREHLSLQELVAVAKNVGGAGHHFRIIQLPYNLAMPEALTRSTQMVDERACPLLEAAEHLGISVCASAPLLQGRLANGLPELVGVAMRNLTTDAQRAIQFVRSTPGIAAALVGMKGVAHVREALDLLKSPAATPDDFARLFH